MPRFLLSVVIPVYNEENNIDPLLDRLLPVIKSYSYEVLFINDGSTDLTEERIRKHCKQNEDIKLISFNRNFGHQNALTAGYAHAQGDAVVSIDADLQDPPEVISQMIEQWQKGAKIVYAKRAKRENDTLFKRFSAHLFYHSMNLLSDTAIPFDVGDYRLLDRVVVRFLNDLPEQTRFLRGLVAWSGYPSVYVEFDRTPRHSGKTHYPFTKMIRFAFYGITSFTTKPLRIASYAGFATAAIGFMGIIYAVVGKLFFQAYWVTGWTALFVGIMFLGGVQLITIGIVGEYIDRIYTEIQKRPMFVIKNKVNI
ncbi:MAG: glycosyltransferase family 2 protein [Patescibacteria group bacterium]